MNWEEIDTNAKNWIKEAGAIIRNSFKDEVTVNYKSNPSDLVTNMDHQVEQFFIEKIKSTYPDHQILGEEGFGDDISEEKGTLWIVDPIDGTMNFVHQQRHFTISVGVYHDGVGMIGLIYDVVSDDLFSAREGNGAFLNENRLKPLKEVEVDKALVGMNSTWVTENRRIDPKILTPLVRDVRGVRSYGSAALEMAYVSAGILDAYITLRLSPWDFAAGLILINEVGGVASTLTGEKIRLLDQNSVIVAKPLLHEQILNRYIKGRLV